MRKEDLKQEIRQIIKEDLGSFLKYDDYQYGDPKQAAEKLIVLTDKYTKSVERLLKLAGPWLSPGIKRELWLDLKKKFDNMKYQQ